MYLPSHSTPLPQDYFISSKSPRSYYVTCFCYCLLVWDRVFPYNPGCPATHSLDQPGFELTKICQSLPLSTGIKDMHPIHTWLKLKSKEFRIFKRYLYIFIYKLIFFLFSCWLDCCGLWFLLMHIWKVFWAFNWILFKFLLSCFCFMSHFKSFSFSS